MWPSTPLGEVLSPVRREREVDPVEAYGLLGVRLEGAGPFLRETKLGSEISAKKLYEVRAGDFIYSRLFAWRGAFGLIAESLDGRYVSGEFLTYNPVPDRVDLRFLKYWFRLPSVLWRVEADCTGSTPLTRNRFKEEFFLALELPLPPIQEQRRILAKIERLAAKVEEARCLRGSCKASADGLLTSLRNELFGKLQNEVKPERLDSVADSRLGKMLSRNLAQDGGGTPYLRNANIQWDRLDLADIKSMWLNETEIGKYSLQSGDVLVCEGGDIGKSAVWNKEIPGCVFQKALHRVRVDRERVLPRFMLHHLIWAAEQGNFQDIKTQTTIAHLTGVKLKAYHVYMPSLEVQKLIVKRLDETKEQMGRILGVQLRGGEELDALLPSILDKAFKGEL